MSSHHTNEFGVGPNPVLISSIYEITPEALEQIAQWFEQRGIRTPISQVVGFSQFNAIPATDVAATQNTTSTTYTDLGTVGPSLTGLADGKYLLSFGCVMYGSNDNGYMSPSVNGSGGSDGTSAQGGGRDDATDVLPAFSVMRSIAVTMTAGGNNSVVAKYRSQSATGSDFSDRWMLALRYGNIR